MSDKFKAIESRELFCHMTPDREHCIDGAPHDWQG
jgi:hypothetical protein